MAATMQAYDIVAGGLLLVAAVSALGLGLAVLRASRGRPLDRRLSALLLVEGIGVTGIGASSFMERPGLEWMGVGWIVFMLAIVAAPWVALSVLARLETPLVAWLRRREWLLLAGPIGLAGALALIAATLGVGENVGVMLVLLFTLGLVPVFSLAVGISAWRRAPRASLARTRAGAFAAAFGARDALLILTVLGLFLLGDDKVNACATGPCPSLLHWIGWNWIGLVPSLAVLVYAPLLAYGILKTRLFDIDLRVKRGLANSLVGGVFVAAFFVAEQVGQSVVSERAGPLLGLAGAGAVALAFAPLRRAATRVAHLALPAATGSAAYVAARKLAVYRAAAEDALVDGEVSPRERASLTRLGADLGVTPAEMAAIEADVLAAGRAEPPTRAAAEPQADGA